MSEDEMDMQQTGPTYRELEDEIARLRKQHAKDLAKARYEWEKVADERDRLREDRDSWKEHYRIDTARLREERDLYKAQAEMWSSRYARLKDDFNAGIYIRVKP